MILTGLKSDDTSADILNVTVVENKRNIAPQQLEYFSIHKSPTFTMDYLL